MEILKGLRIDAVNQLLPVIETPDEQIRRISTVIEGTARENEDALLLTTIPGVSYKTTLHGAAAGGRDPGTSIGSRTRRH